MDSDKPGVVHWLIGLLTFAVIAGGATFLYLQTKPASSEDIQNNTQTPVVVDPVIDSSESLTAELAELTEALSQMDDDIISTDDVAPTL